MPRARAEPPSTAHTDPPNAPYRFNWVKDDAAIRALLESIHHAIAAGKVPLRISQGSSGSYLVFSSNGQRVGIFKPKDEEPYGVLNPKWTKWLHKTCCPCFFGRSCLMTNVGYISEVAASVVDRFLGLNIVPRTELVELAAPTFSYLLWDRIRAWKKKDFGKKIGSFQLWVEGFRNAKEVLWWIERLIPCPADLAQAFQSELEKLVVLDYVIRNTDRGLDNLLIHLSWREGDAERVWTLSDLVDGEESRRGGAALETRRYHVKFAGIDNGLAFPYKHPDNWRSYPYEWLSLPQSRAPFSAATRARLLPLLSDPTYRDELVAMLQPVFRIDANFDERHFSRQMAVLRGQLHNLKEALERGESPWDLAHKPRLLIEDEDDYLSSKPWTGGRDRTARLDEEWSGPTVRRWRREETTKPCFSFC